jgi:hypothetical protein
MKKTVLVILTVITIAACAKLDIVRFSSTSNHLDSGGRIDEPEQSTVPVEELAQLFYSRSELSGNRVRQVQKMSPKKRVDPKQYRVVIDWMKDGTRYVKLHDLKTGQDFIANDKDQAGNIRLQERTLHKYVFIINEEEVAIAR